MLIVEERERFYLSLVTLSLIYINGFSITQVSLVLSTSPGFLRLIDVLLNDVFQKSICFNLFCFVLLLIKNLLN